MRREQELEGDKTRMLLNPLTPEQKSKTNRRSGSPERYRGVTPALAALHGPEAVQEPEQGSKGVRGSPVPMWPWWVQGSPGQDHLPSHRKDPQEWHRTLGPRAPAAARVAGAVPGLSPVVWANPGTCQFNGW